MINTFPAKQGYVQTNRSNILGSLWSSMSLDFQSNLGVMRIGSRLQLNTQTGDSGATNLGTPCVFQYFDNHIFTIAGQRVFLSPGVQFPFIEDTSTGVSTVYLSDSADAIMFNASLCTNDSNNHLFTKQPNGGGTGAWTDRGLLSCLPVSLCYFKKFNRLYAGGVQSINSVDTSWNITISGSDYNIDLGIIGARISCIIADDDNIWIGTYDSTNTNDNQQQQCSILQWDGISQQITNEFKVPASGIMAMILRNNIVHAMDSNGIFREFTGTYFEEIGRLPLRQDQYIGFPNSSSNVGRLMSPRGLVVTENDTILAMINNVLDYQSNGLRTVNENLPAGIWEWSKENNFTHKNPISYNRVSSTTITDFGQNIILSAGGLGLIKIPSVNSKSTIITGCQFFTSATSQTFGIFNDSPKPSNDTYPDVQRKGYFVTTFFLSSQIEDKWERLWNTHKLFKNLTDSIVFKYRLSEDTPTIATITWVDTTHFTTTTDITAYWSSGIGGEVEILNGTGSGSCSHIISIVNNSGVYTVTLDDSVTGVTTGTAIARFQQWIKINPEVSGIIKEWEQMAILSNSSAIEIKGCLTWTGEGEFWKLAIFSNSDIKINA